MELLHRLRGIGAGGRNVIASVAACCATCWGADDLTDLSIEELLNIEVTSVSKKSEKRTAAPAAITVITQDDIRRSGATSVPELLRMVPGVNVARLDANKWSVTSRGFSGRYGNKLLVLIDGRSVYTPNYAGVAWEAKDVFIEDVDRIEVIRGPGGSLWGANAVNGVINIVTKNAEDTQGGVVELGGGTEERGFGGLRYGGTINEDLHYRLYLKYFDRDSGAMQGGGDGEDDWNMGQGGVRLDWKLSERDVLTLQGDIYRNGAGSSLETPYLTFPFRRDEYSKARRDGANVLGRWTRTLSEGSDLQLQVYFDYDETRELRVIDEFRRTLDADFQHRFQAGERNEFIWGAGFRYTGDALSESHFIQYTPDERRSRTFSAFVQDEIKLVPEKLVLTLGTKLEYNDYSGMEVQPNARLTWTPDEKKTVWGAVSRAVRTPSRSEADIHLLDQVFPGRIALVLEGNEDFDSEKLLAYELGYRQTLRDNLAFDVAAFVNDYSELRTIEVTFPRFVGFPRPAHIEVPATARNNLDALTFGFEVGVDWQPKSWWQMRAWYSFLEINLDFHTRSLDIITPASESDTPEQQYYWRNSFDLPRNVQLDATLRYVDELPSLDVEDYLTMDLRLGWQPNENLELSIVGQNLLQPGHTEFQSTFVTSLPTQVERGVFGKVTWRF
ncbi:MAG: TonB-dependent receptor [Candidatus Hydrogenedentota bacterium]